MGAANDLREPLPCGDDRRPPARTKSMTAAAVDQPDPPARTSCWLTAQADRHRYFSATTLGQQQPPEEHGTSR